MIKSDPLQLKEDLVYEEQPIEILDCLEKQLHNMVVPPVKILWANHTTTEVTWELEEMLWSNYPHLFVGIGMRKFQGQNFL